MVQVHAEFMVGIYSTGLMSPAELTATLCWLRLSRKQDILELEDTLNLRPYAHCLLGHFPISREAVTWGMRSRVYP